MKTKRFLLDKLGRDNVVELFQKDGAKLNYHVVDNDDEFLEALTEKIIEELEEVLACETREELVSELADLDDVISTFKSFIKIDQKEIDKAREKNVRKKGGFSKRLYLEYVEVPEGTETYEYLSNNSDRFPEIVADLAELVNQELDNDTEEDS